MSLYVIYSISSTGETVEVDRIKADRINLEEGFISFLNDTEFSLGCYTTEIVAVISIHASCYVIRDNS